MHLFNITITYILIYYHIIILLYYYFFVFIFKAPMSLWYYCVLGSLNSCCLICDLEHLPFPSNSMTVLCSMAP